MSNWRNSKTNLLHKSKRFIIIITSVFFIVVLPLLSIYFYCQKQARASLSSNLITVVIDAGHGGRDGGSIGANGTIEKEINLIYAYALKEKLCQYNYNVKMTRKTDDGLYSDFAKNKKQSDMQVRMNTIKKCNPNLVISIHMNSFSDPNVKGAGAYYRKGDASGVRCAELIMLSLGAYCGQNKNNFRTGDYYILNCNYYTAVLLECGFLSNPEEEKLLNSTEYINQFVEAVSKAIFIYFGNNLL